MSGLAWTVAVIPAMVLIVATLERVWGRPIPRLRHSRAMKLQPIFYAVPAVMLLIPAAAAMFVPMHFECSDCTTESQVWGWSMATVTVGWVVYYMLLLLLGVMRLTLRVVRLLQ